jgi:tRNA G10  N-methylase Trm11
MEHKSIFILGRQPAIGRAELESLFGSERLEPVGDHAMASDLALDEVPFDRIGSTVRLAKPLATLPTTQWPMVLRYTAEQLPQYLDYLPEGKLKLGLSIYGLPVKPNHLLRAGLELKKACKAVGRSARVVPNTELELNTAQVLHNQLTGEVGMELLFIRHGDKTYLAQTAAIQDINAYAKRDRGRPKRDAFVGMLPPKLAQTIVNLGVSQLKPEAGNIVLDPFCGTGVILQEALLMGYGAYGTDLEPRMVDYTRENLEWLSTYRGELELPERANSSSTTLEAGDATDHEWTQPFSAVACETYLGRPLSSWPNPEKLQEIMGTCNVITQKFLGNLAGQIPRGTRICLALPAWVGPNGRIHHLSTLDQLEVLGYNRVSFSWASEQEMVYRRPDQLVARELLVITRK